MVSRKNPPVTTGESDRSSNTVSQTIPPYPTTPIKESASIANDSRPPLSTSVHDNHGFDLIEMEDGRPRTRSNSDASHGTWDTDSEGEGNEGKGKTKVNEADIPKPLRISPSKQSMRSTKEPTQPTTDPLPAILRPGPSGGTPAAASGTPAVTIGQQPDEAPANPWTSTAVLTPKPQPVNAPIESNNPYRQQSAYEPPTSQSVWQEPDAAMPSVAPPPPPPSVPVLPVELPTVSTPANELQNIPWELDRPQTTASYDTVEVIPVPQQGRPPLPPVDPNQAPAFPPTNPWSKEGNTSTQTQPNNNDTQTPILPPNKQPLHAAPFNENQVTQPIVPSQSIGRSEELHKPIQSTPAFPRPTPAQRAEHYSIKCVNWYDADMPGIRRSPILTQNANGPCPLLALVNALTLSTPHDANTALVEALQTRETISLGFLLDAVFDELVSGRRDPGPYGLPDLDELYSFLLALHTGMNVNPRFIPPAVTQRGSLDVRHGMGSHPFEASQNSPGLFEETREMRLYSTFQIPLIHGWMPTKGSPQYQAFERTAPTFEDAQNIQFAESELVDKDIHEGLDSQETQLLADIRCIKDFLQTWPTQLTERGLETISRSLQPGQLAILFRNDHFSTVYKEPKHGALMSLMTDAGYSTHEEIVWESLVDVNGAAAEMFSGDFRVVSHNNNQNLNQNNSAGGEEGWQTVTGRSNQQGQQAFASDNDAPPPLPGPRPTQISTTTITEPLTATGMSAREQEDHDLALALQLQEEEEDRERQELRRREQRLSEQMLRNEAEGVRPEIPPRRNQWSNADSRNNTTSNTRPSGRPAVNRPSDNPSDPDAPPSYQQAASDRPYRPAGAAAAGVQGNPLNTYDTLLAQQSGGRHQTNPTSPTMQGGRRWGDNRPGASSSGHGASSSSGPPPRISHAAGVKDAEEKCTIM